MLNDERDVCYPRYTYFVMSHTSTGLIFTLSFLGSGFGLRLSNGGGSMLGYLPERKKTKWASAESPFFPSPQTTSYPPHAPFYSPTPCHFLLCLSSRSLLLSHPMDLPSDKVIHPPLQTDCQCWLQFLLRCVVDEAIKSTGSVNCTLCPQCCPHIHPPP